ncbi:hypothetical protein BGZ59_003035 [Podila verticillata]|nr:hypothetical protein BGZ59_003035 [Podila verticillata]
MEIASRPHAPSGPISVSGGSNTMSSVETEPSSSSIPGGDAQSNMDPNRKRRGNLPKSVTSVLKNWLVQNAIHPYPTEDEKIKLAEATHLSLNQISNWFINARRRILQPILVEAAAAAVAGTDAPMENVLIVRKGKGSRMQVEMEASTLSNSGQIHLTYQNATVTMDNTSPPSQRPEPPYGTTNTLGASIAPLPPECLEFILEFLSHDLPTLYRLLLVSWQFFHLTIPVLYKSPKPGTGLLADYFRYYTEHDHQSISSVLILLFPGAGRREYDRILAEIEKSILEHNPGKIVSLKIQHPSTVVPHLMQHLSLFHHLSRVELLDSNWTSQELELVCEFLEAHSTLFPASSPDSERPSEYNVIQPPFGRHGLHGIRHLKYRTGRSHWDGVKLRSQPFNPVQLIQAIGSGTGLGLETIDSMHWPETTIEQVNSLDTRCLSKLKICFLVTPHEDWSFSQPTFLRRCRELRHLEIFTSSADMLQWAVQEWNDTHKRRQAPSALLPHLDKSLALHYPWIQGVVSSTAQPKERPLVPLHHLCVHGPSDDIVYNVLRDALYGFRNTLEVCEAKSKLENIGGNSEWLDHADELLSRNKDRGAAVPGGVDRVLGQGRVVSGQESDPTRHQDKDEDELAEECYLSMPSVESGLLTVRWMMPYLAMLDLYGSIALQFDLKSLAYMPQLHTVCFSIRTAPSLWRRRYRRNDDPSGATSRYAGVSDMTCLPLVTGLRLKRVLIRGPWPEISDKSLLEMIETRVENERQDPRRAGQDANEGDDDEDGEKGIGKDSEDEEEATWGNQLLELTVLDNDQVTVPGMVLLARQMDQLEVMGLNLYFPMFQHQYFPSQHRQQQPPPQQDINSHPSNIIQRSYHYFCNPGAGPSSSVASSPPEDAETMARNELLRAQLELPWIDLGPDANHLAKRTRRNGFLNRGWIL